MSGLKRKNNVETTANSLFHVATLSRSKITPPRRHFLVYRTPLQSFNYGRWCALKRNCTYLLVIKHLRQYMETDGITF